MGRFIDSYKEAKYYVYGFKDPSRFYDKEREMVLWEGKKDASGNPIVYFPRDDTYRAVSKRRMSKL